MAINDPLSVEVDSGQYTPQSLLLRRRLAEAMLKQGVDASPIRSPWQGAARLANAIMGGLELRNLEQKEATDRDALRSVTSAGLVPPTSLSTAPGDTKAPTPAEPPSDFTSWLKQKEGFRDKPYSDYKQTSVGYGTRAQPGDENGITREEAEKRLNVEAGKARQLVQAWAADNKLGLSQKQEDALTDLTFNSGTTWMGDTLARAIKAGNLPLAQQAFQSYINAGGKPLDALRARRAELSPWLLDTTPRQPAAPVQVAQAPAQTLTDVPGLTVDFGQNAVPAPNLTAGANLPLAAAPIAPPPAPAPGVPAAAMPGAAPAAAAPPPAPPPPTPAAPSSIPTRQSVVEQAWKQFTPQDAERYREILTKGDPNSPAYKLVVMTVQQAIARVQASQPPIEPMKQAELAYKESQTRENNAQLPKHAADARKATAEARKAELESMRMKTPEEAYLQAKRELDKLAGMTEKYGATEVGRGVGEYMGRVADAARSDPIGYTGEYIAKLGGYLSSLFDGGAPASKVSDEIKGAQATLSQMLRGLTGMSARQGDSNMELQNILTMVGALPQSTSARDLNDRILQINDRIASFTGQQAQDIKPTFTGEKWERSRQGAAAEAVMAKYGLRPDASRAEGMAKIAEQWPGGNAPAPESTKALNGKTYVKIDGQWYEQ